MTPPASQWRFTVGVFQDPAWARRGIQALRDDGFPPESITVLAAATPDTSELIETLLGQPAGRLVVPALGDVAALGPLLAALQGADGGLERSGLAAVIGRAGFQPHDGYIFETLVGRGGVLVGVRSEPRAADALARLHAYGGGNAAIGAWTGRV